MAKMQFVKKRNRIARFQNVKTAAIPLEDKTLAIKSIQIPRKLKELRSFFGSTNQSVSEIDNRSVRRP